MITADTTLHRNPFWLLGATARDDRRRIVELAEAKSLVLDHDVCQKARSDITNPRTRLAAEMAWLPGVSPKRAEQLARQALQDPTSVCNESGLPSLARANLTAAALEGALNHNDPNEAAEFIGLFAVLVDELDVATVMRDINEDRSVSGFPEVKSPEQVESELGERKRYYRAAMKDALNRMSTENLVAVMTQIVEAFTSEGIAEVPSVIDELVDSYEVETQAFLQKEAENVHRLIMVAKDIAGTGESAVKPLVDKLERVTRNWNKVARPIQLSAKARGIQYRPGVELAFSIRGLAVDLFNNHNLLNQSTRITDLLRELFGYVPEMVDRLHEDANALQDIVQERKQAEARQAEWAREITYSAEVGAVFKDVLAISPEGVRWKDQRFPLAAITRLRWGGTRHSINGIPTGTTYTVAFGDNRSEAVVELRREAVYSAFIERLWRAVGIRVLTELLQALKEGKEIRFGEMILRDNGATLKKHKFIGSEPVALGWHQIHVWNANGSFVVGAKDDKKTYVELPYLVIPNVHALEQGIRMAFKRADVRVLSDLLKNN